VIYGNMLEMRQPTNAMQARLVHNISGNYKMGVAKIRKIGESGYKKEFPSMSWAPGNIVCVLQQVPPWQGLYREVDAKRMAAMAT
jgi:hypothetical protein